MAYFNIANPKLNNITIDGVSQNNKSVKIFSYRADFEKIDVFPSLYYLTYESALTTLDNTIYIFGTTAADIAVDKEMSKWWTSLNSYNEVTIHNEESDKLPYYFEYGCAIAYKGQIHILGGSGNATGHYKWTGNSWVSVSILPFELYGGYAVIFNDEIHIFGGRNSDGFEHDEFRHYSWNGSIWTDRYTGHDPGEEMWPTYYKDYESGRSYPGFVYNGYIYLDDGILYDGTDWIRVEQDDPRYIEFWTGSFGDPPHVFKSFFFIRDGIIYSIFNAGTSDGMKTKYDYEHITDWHLGHVEYNSYYELDTMTDDGIIFSKDHNISGTIINNESLNIFIDPNSDTLTTDVYSDKIIYTLQVGD